MGMDVSGRNPSTEAGEYFRANVWSWRPINMVMASTGLLDDNLIQAMGYNDGEGPEDQETCTKLADAIERSIKGMSADHVEMPSEFRVDETGKFLERGSTEGESAYSVSKDHLQEFVGFLRHCGGFEVW